MDFYAQAKEAVQKGIVIASEGKFQEHPEAMAPRVFVRVVTAFRGGMDCQQEEKVVIELLQDGQAIKWPRVPDKKTCGFDFWLIETTPSKTDLGRVNMVRHDLPASGTSRFCRGGRSYRTVRQRPRTDHPGQDRPS